MSTVRHWAVLVGIDFYFEASRRLRGAANDVALVQNYLSAAFPNCKASTFIAVGQNDGNQVHPDGPEHTWPTYRNITKALKNIAEHSSPGDLVLFHFSGHGSRSPTAALEYREDFGSDAALVLYDKHGKNNIRYIRGIELATYFDNLIVKGLKLTVVLDCCYGGSLSRGSTTSWVRNVPWDEEVAISGPETYWPTPLSLQESEKRDAETSQHWLVKPYNYTLLAACGPDEIAAECRGKDGRVYGALTYFLFNALLQASLNRSEPTLRELYAKVCVEFHVPLPQQHPVLLGNPSSAFLVARAHSDLRSPVANVLEIAENGNVRLNLGLAQGVGVDDEYELYPWAQGDTRSSQGCALCTITCVRAFQSDAEIVCAPPNGMSVARGWEAFLKRSSRAKAQVAISPDIGPVMGDLIEHSPWLVLVDANEALPESLPLFRLGLSPNKQYSITHFDDIEITNLPAIFRAADDAENQVLGLLEHLAKYANIEGIGNQQQSLLTGLESKADPDHDHMVREVKPEDYTIEFELEDGSKVPSNGSTLYVKNGKKLRVRFKNFTSVSLYLTIMDLQPLRGVAKLYPSSDRGYYREIPPKGTHFRGVTSFAVIMTIPDQLKEQGILEAEDVLKFFVATRPTCISFAMLELPQLGSTSLVDRDRSNQSESLLLYLERDRRSGRRQRGHSSNEDDRWACHNFIIKTSASEEKCKAEQSAQGMSAFSFHMF